jgi:uncharacterized protein (DUF58 family)
MRLRSIFRLKSDPSDNINDRVYVELSDLLQFKQHDSLALLPRTCLGASLPGHHKSRLRGRGLNFEELRHYRVGDDIRNLDWKVTNRTQKPHVRVYTEETERRTVIAVDQRLSLFFGSKHCMKSVAAAEAAALIGWRQLKIGDRVSGLIFNDITHNEIRPARNQKEFILFLKKITDYNQALNLDLSVTNKVVSKLNLRPIQKNPAQLNHILRRLINTNKNGQLFILISDLSGADTDTEKLVSALCLKNELIIVMVYDPLEIALPKAGKLTISDRNKFLEVNTEDHSLRSNYRTNFNIRMKTIEEFLLRSGVAVIPVHTGGDIVGQIGTLPNRSKTRLSLL